MQTLKNQPHCLRTWTWVTERGRQDEPKQTKQKKNNYVPFRFHLFLSSVIEKYSQISYLQRNEQNSSLIKQICLGLVRVSGQQGLLSWKRNFTSMSLLIWFWTNKTRKNRSTVHVKQRGRMHSSQQTINMATAPIPAPTCGCLQDLTFLIIMLQCLFSFTTECFQAQSLFPPSAALRHIDSPVNHLMNHSWDTLLKLCIIEELV